MVRVAEAVPVVREAVRDAPAVAVSVAVHAPIDARSQGAAPKHAIASSGAEPSGIDEGSGWVSKVILAVVILGCAIGFAVTQGGGEEPPPPPETLLPDRPYILYLSEIEAQPSMPGGVGWDLGDDSAPDLYYEVWWQGNQVYESDIRLDGLIANFVPVGLNLKESLLNGTVSVDQAVRAPLVSYSAAAGDSSYVEIRVYDDDPFPMSDDDVGQFRVALPNLKVGDNSLVFGGSNGIRRVRLRAIDNTLPLAQRVAELMKP